MTAKTPYWNTALRLLLGALLLWAGVSKAADPTAFLGAIHAYQLPLSRPILAGAAVVLPWIELLCGLMLITRTRLAAALLCAVGLFLVFGMATGQALARGLDISCGCFDVRFLEALHLPALTRGLDSVGFAFVRNLALLAAATCLLANTAAPRERECAAA